jgi:hypothetical protein
MKTKGIKMNEDNYCYDDSFLQIEYLLSEILKQLNEITELLKEEENKNEK